MKKIIATATGLILAIAMMLSLLSPAVFAKSPLGDPDLYEQLSKLELKYVSTVYKTPEEKLATMTKAVENDRYALYVQEYTGEVCVVDKVTSQKLFTNPYDVGDSSANEMIKYQLLSQVIMTYTDNSGATTTLESFYEASYREQMTIKQIRNGIRVEYVMGASNKKIIVPYQIEKSRFENEILKPFFENTTDSDLSFEEYFELKNSADPEEVKKAEAAEAFDYSKLISFYSLYDASSKELTAREQAVMLENYPITATLAIYIIKDKISARELTQLEGYIKEHTAYSLEDLLMDHEQVGYEEETTSPPIFKTALEYTLEEDGFQVRLPARGISYDSSTYTLETIQVLPFLGAGRTPKGEAVRQDEGYNFIPDGSGAIVDFRQAGDKYTRISGTMYGVDYGFYNSTNAATASFQTWRVPVYGTVYESTALKTVDLLDEDGNVLVDEDGNVLTETVENKQKQGYVAFMTEGDSLARIDMVSGGNQHEYNSVYTTFFARQTDSYPLDGITVSGGTATYTKAIERRYVGNYVMKYRMLWEDDATYVGMAAAYRDYLVSSGTIKKAEDSGEGIPLYLDFIGEIDTTQKILGVPVSVKTPLTTFENAKTILSELEDEQITNLTVRYKGWMNGGMKSTAPASLSVESKLGGEKGLKDLIAYMQEKNNALFMDFDFSYVNAVGLFDGFDTESHAAKTIDNEPALQKIYNPAAQTFVNNAAYVLTAKAILPFYQKVTEKYSNFFGEGEKSISVSTLGDSLNSTQDKNFPLNREEAKEYTVASLEKIREDYDRVMTDYGNAYTWNYATDLLNLPLDSSGRNNFTAEIPFIGLVLHGYVRFAGEAINLAGDYEYNLLKTIENGANPYFVLAYQNIGELKLNSYSRYYAVEYDVWKDSIIEEYKKLNETLAPVQDVVITSHETLSKRVVKVGYENGVFIYLNYNDFAVTADGMELTAMSFKVTTAAAD